MLHIDGHRCFNKMLPLSKFCYNHVCNDPEQQLFSICSFKFSNGKKCTEPANTFSSSCHLHNTLSFNKSYKKSVDIFQNAKQRYENRKRKMVGKEREKKEPRTKRSSARLKECSLSFSSISDEYISSGNTRIHSTINQQKNGDKIVLENSGDKTLQEKVLEGFSVNDSNTNSEKTVKFEPHPSFSEMLQEMPKEGNIFEKGLFQPSNIFSKSSVSVNEDSSSNSEARPNQSDVAMPASDNKSETYTRDLNKEDPNKILQANHNPSLS